MERKPLSQRLKGKDTRQCGTSVGLDVGFLKGTRVNWKGFLVNWKGFLGRQREEKKDIKAKLSGKQETIL